MYETLIPVIVGGIIGVVGGLAGPPLAHWLTVRTEKRTRRAAKLEELIGALYEFNHWLDIMKNIRVFGAEDTQPLSPWSKVRAISALYFPEFADGLSEVERLADAYQMWTLQAAQRRLHNETGKLNEGLNEAYAPYAKAFARMLRLLGDYAKKEFAA